MSLLSTIHSSSSFVTMALSKFQVCQMGPTTLFRCISARKSLAGRPLYIRAWFQSIITSMVTWTKLKKVIITKYWPHDDHKRWLYDYSYFGKTKPTTCLWRPPPEFSSTIFQLNRKAIRKKTLIDMSKTGKLRNEWTICRERCFEWQIKMCQINPSETWKRQIGSMVSHIYIHRGLKSQA